MGTAREKSDFQLFGDKNQYVLAPRNKGSFFVSKTYAITDEYKTFIVEEEGKIHEIPHLQMEGEYWNLILYNLDEEGLPERKIDLFQAVRSYNQKSVPTRLIGSYYVEDTHYFGLDIRDLTDEENWVIRTVYLNLETEEVVELPKDTRFGMNDDIKEILFELKQLNNLLFKFHKKSKIVFDFSIVKNLNYYNGIILQGYIEGFPNVILTGGRYDKLFEKFGVDTGAVGFAILTDSLKGYYKDEDKNDFEILIAYDNSDFEKLVEIVNDFQEKGLRVRTENIENLKENDSEIFNYDEKYLFRNGNLINEKSM